MKFNLVSKVLGGTSLLLAIASANLNCQSEKINPAYAPLIETKKASPEKFAEMVRGYEQNAERVESILGGRESIRKLMPSIDFNKLTDYDKAALYDSASNVESAIIEAGTTINR